MKTKFICFVIILFVSQFIMAQTPNWIWAKDAGGNKFDWGQSLANDNNGNVYLTGFFASTSITLGSVTLNNSGSPAQKLFIAKYNNQGSVLWAKGVGGNSYTEGHSVTTDGNSNVYVTGAYGSSITFDNLTLSGTNSAFIVKYDSSGNFIWAQKVSASVGGEISSYGIKVDNSGHIYIGGDFTNDTLHFGNQTFLNSTSGTSPRKADIYIAKYDTSGNIIWAKTFGGNGNDYAGGWNHLSVSNSGVFITGRFESSTLAFGTTTLNNGGNANIYIAKINTNGNVLWANSVTGSRYDEGISSATDINGNVIIAGSFTSSVVVCNGITVTNASTTGSTDIFIAKYNSAGAMLWAKGIGGIYDGRPLDNDGSDGCDESGYGITTDVTGNIYVTGLFRSSTILFGTTTLTTHQQGYDVFVSKLDASGSVLWAKSAGSNYTDFGVATTVDNQNKVYITGFYDYPSIAFGGTVLNYHGTGGPGDVDIFIAKIDNVSSIPTLSQWGLLIFGGLMLLVALITIKK